MIKTVSTSEPNFETAFDAIRNRLERLERISSPSAQRKTEEIFGRPLSPREVVQQIIHDVRAKGDEALLDYTRRLDGCELTAEDLKVTDRDCSDAYEQVPPELLAAIRAATENVRRYQQHIKIASPQDFVQEGARIETRYQPLASVGVYVPGMLGAYPSTPIMAIVPAKVAGVERVVVTTPPAKDGKIAAATLVAAKEAGADEIYRVGGVQAIAALAFGTDTIPRVDKVVGPGNLFVMLAKKEIFGQADIDLFAGPSEILIIADAVANEDYVAADMLSQAEHDPMASAILVTTSEHLAEAVIDQIEAQLAKLPTRAVAQEALDNYGLIVVASTIDEAIAIADQMAPEHLEIITAQPAEVGARIRNAGAIFLGPHTPEVVGDYIAGSSHILPTGGTARFFSGLSVNDFLRKTAVIEYSFAALRNVLGQLTAIGTAEGFAAHVASAQIRFPKTHKPTGRGRKK